MASPSLKRFARSGMYAAGGLMTLIVLALGGLYGVSRSHFQTSFEVAPSSLTLPTDSAAIAFGAHLARSRGCMDCHGERLAGSVFIDHPAMGRFAASNLTPGEGGVGQHYTVEDWDRAIRHGVRPDGSPLLFMPSYEYTHYSDEDVARLIAYLRSLEPVDNELPPLRVGPMARALYLKGDLPLVAAKRIDHAPGERAAPEPGPTAEYGAYIAPSCLGCHGERFSGGPIPGTPPDWPPASNLTSHESGLAGWTEADFMVALREGVRPDGSELKQPYMPVSVTRHLEDYEVRALWAYLQTLPPQPAGNR